VILLLNGGFAEMTKTDYLNTASDLRRIANWMARGQKEKLPLIIRLWNNIQSQEEALKLVKSLVGEIKPQDALKDKKLRLFFAEQSLLSSIRLQNKFSP
jgi:hypothetical protein